MEQLVVRLGTNTDEPIHWIVWSSQQNEIIASGELPNAVQLNTLADRAGRRPICVLVPTSDVLLKWVELPAKAGRKALAAIPFILEEEISGDISQQFFFFTHVPQTNADHGHFNFPQFADIFYFLHMFPLPSPF